MNPQRWSYRVIDIKPSFWTSMATTEGIEAELNRMGTQGWELVSIANGGKGWTQTRLIFKRPE
jgi:hypothetical protein